MELSQKGLADPLGYSDQQVRHWETEKADIPASRLLRLLVREWEEKADMSASFEICLSTLSRAKGSAA